MKEGHYNLAYEITKGESILDVQESTNGTSSLTSINGFYWTADPITYSWNNVNVFTKTEKSLFNRKKGAAVKTKQILKDVSGICRPGELLAIMGASGAGKTTLLNVLTGRSGRNLAVKGDLFVNGQRTAPADLTRRSAYVQQEDLFIGTLTVREQLEFQAALRMDANIPTKQRMERVTQVITELGLKKCSDTLIGIPGRLKGISGGETKRLAFACEVLTNPALMFCDEPTSGLDSFMAENIVACMRNLALQGKTIISTIHQPSSEVFAMFDRVLLMAEGRVAFLGLTSDALEFFQSLGHSCPRNFNPADFFISTLAITPDNEKKNREFVTTACEAFRQSSHGISIYNAIMDNQTSMTELITSTKSKVSPYKASWCPMFGAVLKRAWLEVVREPMLFKIKLFQTIMIALLLGIIYWGQKHNQAGITNINGALFLLITNVTFNNTFGVVNTFCAQIPIFMREHKNGMYRVDTYFLAKNMAELPMGILFPCIFAAVIYYMIGFNPGADNFFVCMAILLLVANCGISFGYFVSCVSVNINMALAIAAPLIIPLMLFGGFFLNSQTVPVYFIWLQYISWFNYGNEALMLNQWQDVDYITCELPEESFCMSSGHDVLKKLGYSDANIWVDVAALAAILIGFRVLAFCALLAKSYRK